MLLTISTTSFGRAWVDGVVPFGMEVVADDVQRRHLGVADLDALLVDAGIEGAFDLQSGFCGRCADQLDDGEAIGQGPAAPVLRDVAEHAMFDLVPFRRSRRIVENVQGKPGLVGEFLELALPQPQRPWRARTARRGREWIEPSCGVLVWNSPREAVGANL